MRALVITNDYLRRYHWHRTADLGLVWGLERRGVEWREVLPGNDTPPLDNVDVVLSWWGRQKRKRRGPLSRIHHHPVYRFRTSATVSRYVFDMRVEAACRERGIPVVNALSRRSGMCHSHGMDTWRAHGIGAAECQRYGHLDEITLEYPLVLRTDGGTHSSADSAFAADRRAAEAIVAERVAARRKPMNLAIRFVDNVFPDGYYRKRRSFVIGDRVIPRQLMLSASWKVKLENVITGEPAIGEDRRFMTEGEEEEDLVRRAAKLLGPEIVALDYTRRADGSYVFWEGNPRWGMAGLDDHPLSVRFRAATGRAKEECREEHARLGEAIADLMIARARGARAA